MKELRDKRREKGLCTRCGHESENDGYILCQECRDYIKSWKEDSVKDYREDKEEVIIRELRVWDIENETLYNTLIDKKIKISELAEMIDVTPRSVQRWVFEDTEPSVRNKKKINQVLGKKIYTGI